MPGSGSAPIVGMDGDKVTVYRLGGLAVETDRGGGRGECRSCGIVPLTQSAPGMLTPHRYAAREPLLIGDMPELIQAHHDKKR
jgi:L-threonylcarbamoyladenylate synthase